MPAFCCVAFGLRRQTGNFRRNAGTHSHACPHPDHNCCAYAGTYTPSNGHSYAGADANSYSTSNTQAHTGTYADTPSNTQAYVGTRTCSYADSPSDCHTDADSNSPSNAHAYTGTRPHAKSCAYTWPSGCGCLKTD